MRWALGVLKKPIENSVLGLLVLHDEGLSAAQLLAQLRPRVSQPTLWRALDALRAQGALTREGQRSGDPLSCPRSYRGVGPALAAHASECVAKRLVREPGLALQALERLGEAQGGSTRTAGVTTIAGRSFCKAPWSRSCAS
jgi:hypothetical protein